MSARNYSNTAAQSTLSASIAATDTSITLTGYSGDPTPPFTAALARGTANEEIVLITAVIGSTVTVTRGYDGTAAKAQSAGATFQEVVAALDFREANNHINSGAVGVHGTTSPVVGVNDTQTLTNKTLTAPTITSPSITGTATVATANVTTLTVSGVTSLASLSTSGNATVGGTLGVTGAATLSAGLTVAGVAALNGGGTVPTGKKLTLTDAPAATTDGANKAYVDAKTWPTTALSDATAAPTANLAIKRDGNGRAQVADPSVAADISTKNYVDTAVSAKVAGLPSKLASGTTQSPTIAQGAGSVYANVPFGVTFTTAPIVTVTGATSGNEYTWLFWVTAVSTTNATVLVHWTTPTGGAPTNGNVTFNWIAVGN